MTTSGTTIQMQLQSASVWRSKCCNCKHNMHHVTTCIVCGGPNVVTVNTTCTMWPHASCLFKVMNDLSVHDCTVWQKKNTRATLQGESDEHVSLNDVHQLIYNKNNNNSNNTHCTMMIYANDAHAHVASSCTNVISKLDSKQRPRSGSCLAAGRIIPRARETCTAAEIEHDAQ